MNAFSSDQEIENDETDQRNKIPGDTETRMDQYTHGDVPIAELRRLQNDLKGAYFKLY